MDRDLVRRQAVEAERISGTFPNRAKEIAEQVRKQARRANDPLALCIAERALGLAERELNHLAAAKRYLRRSIAIAENAGLESEAETTRGRLAYVISLSGDTDHGLAEIDTSSEPSSGVVRARVHAQRALLLQRAGRFDQALEEYRLAIPTLRRHHQYLDESRARNNRSVLFAYKGNIAAADADLDRVEELGPLASWGVSLPKIHHNRGFAAACLGDVPRALSLYDQAQGEFAALRQPEAPVLSDRCGVLLSVGLATEGLDAALAAVAELEELGSAFDLAEARLMAARAALLAGDLAIASKNARRARTEFRRQARHSWETLAEYVIARASLLSGRRANLSGIPDLAEKLTEAGWLLPALELRLSFATIAIEHHDREQAIEQLEIVSRYRNKRPALIGGHGWHAEALLRLLQRNGTGCGIALRSGLRVLDQHHAALGASDLQAHASSNARELALLGCRRALALGTASGVFEWAERWRAGALRHRPVRPVHEPEVEQLLAELRQHTVEMETAALEGRPTGANLHRQARLEAAIRDKTRHLPGSRHSRLRPPPPISALRRELDDRTLVEFLACDGYYHAVVVTPRRTKLFRLGLSSEILQEVDSLRFSYARLARGRGSANTLDTFADAAERASQRLDDMLFAPLAAILDDGPLVVVPTGRLHHLPWAGLATCADRTVSVAPSAAMWMNATQKQEGRRSNRVVLVAGPGLPHAETEINDLHKIYPEATVLMGKDATTARVAQALDGARIAHIAAHGTFRADNPLFSALHLADGRLTVYDLELIKNAPELLVLSSCDSGLNSVKPGDELLGLSAAVLSLGTTNLMASVMPVPDLTTAAFMVDVFGHLAKGERPPDALARARNDRSGGGRLETVSAAGFVCFGA